MYELCDIQEVLDFPVSLILNCFDSDIRHTIMPTRIENCLKSEKLFTVRDVLDYCYARPKRLLHISNFGTKCFLAFNQAFEVFNNTYCDGYKLILGEGAPKIIKEPEIIDWEFVTIQNYIHSCRRLKVYGGWILETNLTSTGRVTATFIPDEFHRWPIDNYRRDEATE